MAATTLARTKPETNHRYRTDLAICEIPDDFKRRTAAADTIAPYLDRYHASGTDADRNALIQMLLPLVMKLAQWRRNKTRFPDELDELVSDGALALHGLIERYGAMPDERFLCQCHSGIRWAFVHGAVDRGRWRKQNASPKQKLIRTWRRKFIKENGRAPSDQERGGYIATLITNPEMEVKPAGKRQIPFSALTSEREKGRPRQYADPRPSVAPLIDQDTIEFALSGFVGVDRKIFKLSVLDGMDAGEIAKQLGMKQSATLNRINGLLWQARSRCDLARAVGREPSQMPEPLRCGKYPSMARQPPARLVG